MGLLDRPGKLPSWTDASSTAPSPQRSAGKPALGAATTAPAAALAAAARTSAAAPAASAAAATTALAAATTAPAAAEATNAPAAATQNSAAQPALRVVDSATNLRKEIFDHFYDARVWDADAKQWLPQKLETPLRINEAYWKQVLKDAYPAECVLESVIARFFEDEPDANRGDKPRLDITFSFADSRWVRYHPKAILIWSDEQLPSQAMRARYNRAAKLQKRGYRRH